MTRKIPAPESKTQQTAAPKALPPSEPGTIHATESGFAVDTLDCSLELLASVAVRLLRNDDYPDAVRRAVGLLSECQRWRDSLSRNRTLMEQIEKSQAEREAAPEPVMRYPQALKEIFGTSASKLRQDRAEPKLLRAIAEVYGSEDVAPLLLAQFKREGIEASIVEQIRDEIENAPRVKKKGS